MFQLWKNALSTSIYIFQQLFPIILHFLKNTRNVSKGEKNKPKFTIWEVTI